MAFEYSEDKAAVKVELEVQQQSQAQAEGETPKAGGFNRFKKSKTVPGSRQPLCEVTDSEASGMHSSQCESQDSMQIMSDQIDYEAKYRALLRESTQQRRVLTKLQVALQKKDEEIADEVARVKKQLTEEFHAQARETEEETQLILSNQADQHKDEVKAYETQLEALRTKIR